MATVNASNSPAKKSLRSKRLMRPGSNGAKQTHRKNSSISQSMSPPPPVPPIPGQQPEEEAELERKLSVSSKHRNDIKEEVEEEEENFVPIRKASILSNRSAHEEDPVSILSNKSTLEEEEEEDNLVSFTPDKNNTHKDDEEKPVSITSDKNPVEEEETPVASSRKDASLDKQDHDDEDAFTRLRIPSFGHQVNDELFDFAGPKDKPAADELTDSDNKPTDVFHDVISDYQQEPDKKEEPISPQAPPRPSSLSLTSEDKPPVEESVTEVHHSVLSSVAQEVATTSAGLPKISEEGKMESVDLGNVEELTETAHGSGNSAREYPLGRSKSMRHPRAVGEEEEGGQTDKRQSLLVNGNKPMGNRRSILLTSFVPPVGMANAGPPSSPSTRSSNDNNHQDQEQLLSSENSSVRIMSRNSIRLSAGEESSVTNDKPSIGSVFANFGERINTAVAKAKQDKEEKEGEEDDGKPSWLKEVQKRKREAKERDEAAKAKAQAEAQEEAKTEAEHEAVKANIKQEEGEPPLMDVDLDAADKNKPLPAVAESEQKPAANPNGSRSIYRSLSASLGIGQPDTIASVIPQGPPMPAVVDERQRATSQSNDATPSSPSQSQQQQQPGSLLAAVSSFFGRSSSSQQSTPTATTSNTSIFNNETSRSSAATAPESRAKDTVEFPGMRPSQSADTTAATSEMDMLLSQLEAQNQQILKDNKARVFTLESNDQQSASSPTSQANNEAEEDASVDWDFWGNLINNYDKVSKSEPRKLARSVHAGIPKAVRGTVWQLMTGSRSDPALATTYQRLAARVTRPDSEEAKHEKQIRQDLARTFPKLAYFQDAQGAGQEGLFSVLRAYAHYDREVGYCQGLSFVVGPLLMMMPDEEAFCVLARLMYTYGLRGHFLPTMDDLQLRLFQFEHILHDTLPSLFKHFQQQGVKPTMYVSQWLMTMFAYRLPIQLTFRLFDVVFAEGLDCLLRVSIAVLKRSQARLLCLEFESILQFLNDGPLFAFYSHASADMLVRDANQVTAVTSRKLERLRRMYIEEVERRLEAEDADNRLRADNQHLKEENARLREQLQESMNRQSETRQSLHRQSEHSQQLQQTVDELQQRVAAEQQVVEDKLRKDMDQLAQKNVQLTVKNQQMEDGLQDMESALVQIKMLYAESENEREELSRRFEDLRKALK